MITTFTQAERLKKLGFDRECDNIYWEDGDCEEGMGKYNFNQKDILEYSNMTSAPTVSESLDWISEIKGIDNGVYPAKIDIRNGDVSVINYVAKAIDINTEEWKDINVKQVCQITKSLAESVLLDEVLTYLEKKGE